VSGTLYYRFRPELRPLAAGASMDLNVTLEKTDLPASTCKEWQFSVEVAYLSRAAADGVRLESSQDSQRYILERQVLVRSPVTMWNEQRLVLGSDCARPANR
jgi:hypothetical protein